MKNIFGTDGIRGRVGDGFFTDQSLMQLGDALAVWLVERYGDNVGILLAHDTRISSGFIKSVLKSRLLLHKIDLYDAQVLPTPGVFQLIQDDRRFEAGTTILSFS